MKAGMRRVGPWTSAVLALCVAASAKAEFFPVPGKLDPRIRTVVYERDQVYRLYGFVGYALDLVFGAYLARVQPDLPATEVFSKEEIEALGCTRRCRRPNRRHCARWCV